MSKLLPMVLLGLAFLLTAAANAGELKVDRLSFRLNYVMDAEKLHRASAVAEGDDFSSVGAPDGIVAQPSDSIVVQVACVDADGNAAFPEQAMLRFADTTGMKPVDTIFPLMQKRLEMRKEVTLLAEIRADRDFWRPDGVYRVEIIVGDSRMSKGIVWTVAERFSFDAESASVFKVKPRGVFDFDMGVKKHLLPEFITSLPAAEKQAPLWIVKIFTVLSTIPMLFLLMVWSRMGVFPLQLPTTVKERVFVVFFQLCLIGHVVVLAMFWLRWNIVLTWQAIALNMVPTLYFGHRVLSAKATRDYMVEKVNLKAE